MEPGDAFLRPSTGSIQAFASFQEKQTRTRPHRKVKFPGNNTRRANSMRRPQKDHHSNFHRAGAVSDAKQSWSSANKNSPPAVNIARCNCALPDCDIEATRRQEDCKSAIEA